MYLLYHKCKAKALCVSLFIFSLLFTSCIATSKTDYSLQTLYKDYWGKSEEEFLSVYPMDTGSWERTEDAKRDFNHEKHNRSVYRSKDAAKLSGFPCEIEIIFTENYGMTSLYYAIKQENLSREDCYQLIFTAYDDLCGLFGEPGGQEEDASYWFEYDDIDAFFDYLNTKAKKQNGCEIYASWNDVSAEYPTTMADMSGFMLLPYEDSGVLSLELRINRDVTENIFTNE